MRVRFQPDQEGLRKLVSELREAVAREGRDPRDIKFFMGITAVVGRTEREARDKHAEYLRYASPEAGLAHYASSTGIDFSTYAPDEPIRYVKNNAIESAVRSLTVARTDRTVRDLLADMALGGRYPALVGSAAQVADELESWVAETGIDGFNLARTVTPECYEDFIDLVIPELQSRGSYKTAYADGTLREAVRRGPGGLAGRTRGRARRPPRLNARRACVADNRRRKAPARTPGDKRIFPEVGCCPCGASAAT